MPRPKNPFPSFPVPLQSPDAPLVSQMPGRDAPHTLLNVVRSRGPGRVRDAVLFDNLEAKKEVRESHHNAQPWILPPLPPSRIHY